MKRFSEDYQTVNGVLSPNKERLFEGRFSWWGVNLASILPRPLSPSHPNLYSYFLTHMRREDSWHLEYIICFTILFVSSVVSPELTKKIRWEIIEEIALIQYLQKYDNHTYNKSIGPMETWACDRSLVTGLMILE